MKKETLSTSEKEVPKHKNALEEKYKSEPTKEPLNPENIQEQKSQLPVLADGVYWFCLLHLEKKQKVELFMLKNL